MTRLCGHIPLYSMKDAEFGDEVGDFQLLHFFQFRPRTKCKVAQNRLPVRRRSTC